MSFLQPGLLAVLLPFILLPIIIHFINRMRYTPMDWAAMEFLFRAKRSSTKFAKLREILILACRCLAIFCLAFALSRPLTSGWLGWNTSGSSDTVVILLDRSSSMAALDESGQKNKLQKSIAMIKDAAKNLPDDTEFVLVDSATGKASTIKSPAILDDELLFGTTDTTTNKKSMLMSAYDWIESNNPGSCEIWITGDLQASNWQSESEGWDTLRVDFNKLNSSTKFRMLALSHVPEKNTGIEVTGLKRYVRGPKNYLDITVRIFRDRTGEDSIQVKTNFNGVETVRDIDITQESLVYTQTFELNEDDNGGYGLVSIPDDRNPGDNSWYFAYGNLLDLKTVILSQSTNAPLLKLAAAPVRGLNLQSAVIDAAQLSSNLSDTSLVAVESRKLDEAQQKQLLNFVEKGGRIILFPPLLEDSEIFGLIKAQAIETSEGETAYSINSWDEIDGPLANSRQGEKLPVNKLFVKKRQLPESSGEVLAAYNDGRPFLSRFGKGKGAVYYCSTGIDKEWSDLYKGAILLPMMMRMVNEGAGQYSSIVNEICRYEENYDNLKPVLTGSPKAIKSFAAGVYNLNGSMVVLNRSKDEDRPARLSEEKIEALFAGLDFSMFNQTTDESSETFQTELFTMFAVMILIFLAVEGFLTLRKPAMTRETIL